MKLQIEYPLTCNFEENQANINRLVTSIVHIKNIDECKDILRRERESYKGWFFYFGGDHVAIHLMEGRKVIPERIFFIHE